MNHPAGWRFAWDRGEASVAALGAMLGPVSFDLGNGQRVQPFAIAPWSGDRTAEHAALPPLLRQLRGEWVCVPFGMPEAPASLPAAWRPAGLARDAGADFHGYSSNADWDCISCGDGAILLSLDYPIGHPVRRVTRRIAGIAGHPRVELELEIEMGDEPAELPLGLHPVFRLPAAPHGADLHLGDGAVVHTYPVAAEPGVSRIAPGLAAVDPGAVPLLDGSHIDLRRLPLDFATEELVLVTGHGGKVSLTNGEDRYQVRMGWQTEDFPGCMLWISNRGRTAYPWNGRFCAIGIEPVVAPFDLGTAVARLSTNPLSAGGIPTARLFAPGERWSTRYWIEVGRVGDQ